MAKVIQIERVQDTQLYKELAKRNNEATRAFVGNIPDLCNEASDRAKLLPQFFKEYTLHDRTHFLRVTELMALVLGEMLKSLNDVEIGVLILAAFYHDQGMLLAGPEWEQLEKEDNYVLHRANWIIDHANYKEIEERIHSTLISVEERTRLYSTLKELDAAILTDYLRDKHGDRSAAYITTELSRDPRLNVEGRSLATTLAQVCLSHVKSPDWITEQNGLAHDLEHGQNIINARFLAVVLRLADILDFDSDRTPDVLFKSIHFTSSISLQEWTKHRAVSGWTISREMVRFSMEFEHPVYERTAREFMDWIDDELSEAHRIVRSFPKSAEQYKLNVASKVDRGRIGPKPNTYRYHDLEFSLSRDEIVKLLLTDNLYGSAGLCIRELLQNSLDALRLRKALYKTGGMSMEAGGIRLRHLLDDKGREVVECVDDGCGMDENVINRFFARVGRSYYKSPEFDRVRVKLKEADADFDPCSQFGIGFMSCFMLGDKIEVQTRKDFGPGKEMGPPLCVEINGLGGMIVIRKGTAKQAAGTTVRIYRREHPVFVDEWADRVQLVQNIQGYALATEFPIEGTCSIPGIEGKVTVPIEMDVKRTRLEELGITKVKTFEQLFSEVHPGLRGRICESVLVDSTGQLVFDNEQGKWTIQPDKTWKDHSGSKLYLTNKLKDETVEFGDERLMGEQSVCLDGILVCGKPGRSGTTKPALMLGHQNSRVSTEHRFTVDVRGKVRPELTPARLPVERGGLNTPAGWTHLQYLVHCASGNLWKSCIEHFSDSTKPDLLWRLLVMRQANVLAIPSHTLHHLIPLPTENGKWLAFGEIDCINTRENHLEVKTRGGEVVNILMPQEICIWAETTLRRNNFLGLLSHLLTCMSELRFHGSEAQLMPRKTFELNERPMDARLSSGTSHLLAIPFVGIGLDFIAAFDGEHIVNANSSLVKTALGSKFSRHKEDIEHFAEGFLFLLGNNFNHLKKEGKPISLGFRGRDAKYIGLLYQRIDWSKHTSEVKPPYKIFVSPSQVLEVTEAEINAWADA